MKKVLITLSLFIGLAGVSSTSLAGGVEYYTNDYSTEVLRQQQDPSAGAMFIDTVLGRPLAIIGFAVGTATFIVTSPFSLMGGNIDQAANRMVWQPFKAAFARCLGCNP